MRLVKIMVVLSSLLLPSAAFAQSLMDLLSEGPIAQVRYDSRGKFKQAVGVSFIKAPPEKVWEVMTNLDRYIDFMPQLVEMKVIKREGNVVETSQEVEVPGPNAKYIIRNEINDANHTMRVTYVSGSIKGGSWSYQLKPYNDGTLLYYYCYSMLPGYITAIEDETQTMTIGVNVATAVAVVNAFKECVEKGYPSNKKTLKKD